MVLDEHTAAIAALDAEAAAAAKAIRVYCPNRTLPDPSRIR